MDFWTALVIIFAIGAVLYLAALYFGWKLLSENPWYGVAAFFLVLLIIDIAIPDPLPLLDEIVLGLGTFLTSKKALTGKFGFKANK